MTLRVDLRLRLRFRLILLLSWLWRGEVEVEGAGKVVGKGFVEEAVVKVTVADDRVLAVAIVAEENGVKLSAVLRGEPVDAVVLRWGGEGYSQSQLQIRRFTQRRR